MSRSFFVAITALLVLPAISAAAREVPVELGYNPRLVPEPMAFQSPSKTELDIMAAAKEKWVQRFVADAPSLASENAPAVLQFLSVTDPEVLTTISGTDEGQRQRVVEALQAALDATKPSYLRAVSEGGLFLLASLPQKHERLFPRSIQDRQHRRASDVMDTVVLFHEGRFLPVYGRAGVSIAGFDVTPDRKWLLVVHVGGLGYEGANAPPVLQALEIVVVDLATLATTTIGFDEGEGAASVAVAFEAPERVRVRLKDGSDGRVYSCRLSTPPCSIPGKAQKDPAASFPRAGVLEVTGSTAFRIVAAPPGFAFAPNMVTRSVRPSPKGSRVIWVTQETSEGKHDGPPKLERTLWVRDLPNGEPRRLANGSTWQHALWLDENRILLEAGAEPTPWLAREMARIRKEAPGESRDLKSGERELYEALLASEAMERLAKRFRWWSAPFHWFRLKEVDVRTGHAKIWPHARRVRLVGQSRGQKVDGRGEPVDVQQDILDGNP